MTPTESARFMATLLAVDPCGLGGVCLRTPLDSRLDAWLGLLRELLPRSAPVRRVSAAVCESQLFGGLDLTETLRRRTRTMHSGLLDQVHDGVLILAMAERLSAGTACRLGAMLDGGALEPPRFGIVALDEGLEEEERLPAGLMDRLAFSLAVRELDPHAALLPTHPQRVVAKARVRYPRLALSTGMIERICAASEALGVNSPRVQILASRVARAAAALRGASHVEAEDIAQAILLAVLPRATRLPAQERHPEPPPPESGGEGRESEAQAEDSPEPTQPAPDRTANAALAQLPPDLLERLRPHLVGRAPVRAGRAGATAPNGGRGRPTGSSSRQARSARLDLVATLKAAVPWQRLRVRRPGAPVRILSSDLRYTRFKQRSRTLVVFAVDASGSAALHRLAEAKGAVELILGECYVRRDEVAVVGFRQRAAQILLPPTRSLVRAKRELAGLAGGGGTPLPAGIVSAREVALAARQRGRTPLFVLLTDGHANIDLAGVAGRQAAHRDALRVARQVRSDAIATLLIDTAPRPQALARELSIALGGEYVALPSSDATAIAARLHRSLDGQRAGP